MPTTNIYILDEDKLYNIKIHMNNKSNIKSHKKKRENIHDKKRENKDF